MIRSQSRRERHSAPLFPMIFFSNSIEIHTQEPFQTQFCFATFFPTQLSTRLASLPTLPTIRMPRVAKRKHQESPVDKKLKRDLAKARNAIKGKISPRLRAKKSKMEFEIPNITLAVYTALIQKDTSQLVKKGAYYTMESVMPKELLPGVFNPGLPDKKRLCYSTIDPKTGYVRGSTNGYPKSVQTHKACELRYKPSTQTLSVTAWNDEIESWQDCCRGLTFRNPNERQRLRTHKNRNGPLQIRYSKAASRSFLGLSTFLNTREEFDFADDDDGDDSTVDSLFGEGAAILESEASEDNFTVDSLWHKDNEAPKDNPFADSLWDEDSIVDSDDDEAPKDNPFADNFGDGDIIVLDGDDDEVSEDDPFADSFWGEDIIAVDSDNDDDNHISKRARGISLWFD